MGFAQKYKEQVVFLPLDGLVVIFWKAVQEEVAFVTAALVARMFAIAQAVSSSRAWRQFNAGAGVHQIHFRPYLSVQTNL